MLNAQQIPAASQKAIVDSLSQAAEGCRMKGQYQQAEPLYRQALALAEHFFGSNHLEVAGILNNLGVLFKYTGRFTEAERLYQRALAIMESVLGPDHTEVATLCHNLGGLEHARGRYSKGEPWARRSVKIRNKALGASHPNFVSCQENLHRLALRSSIRVGAGGRESAVASGR